MGALSDEQLLGRFLGGDERSFELLVSRWQRPLFSFACRVLGRPEEARDVCQEAFLRVFSRADRFRAGGRFSTWLYQITLNLCRDILRRRQRWERIMPDEAGASLMEGRLQREAASDAESAEGVVARTWQRLRLRRALAAIPPEQREVVVMKEFQGLRFREIAEILDCPESTVKSRMYYGLVNLRSVLADTEKAPAGGRRTT